MCACNVRRFTKNKWRYKLMKKMILAAMAAVCMIGASGCVGGDNGFALTRKVYKWNKSLDGLWVQELVFLVASIIPVYGFSALIDALILNSIDFWTGSNPVASKTIEMDGQKAVMTMQDDGTILVSSEKGEFRLVKVGDKVSAYDMNGAAITAM